MLRLDISFSKSFSMEVGESRVKKKDNSREKFYELEVDLDPFYKILP